MARVKVRSRTDRAVEMQKPEEMIYHEVVTHIESRLDHATKYDVDGDGCLVVCLSQFKGLRDDATACNRVVSTYVAAGYPSKMCVVKSCPACRKRKGQHIKIRVL